MGWEWGREDKALGSLCSCCVAVYCSRMCLLDTDVFEEDAWTAKSLLSGKCITIRKAVRYQHCKYDPNDQFLARHL